MKKAISISILCVLLVCWLTSCININISTTYPSETVTTPPPHNDTISQMPSVPESSVTEPSNGYVFEEIPVSYGSAPLEINTEGTGGYYFVLDPISLYCGGDSANDFHKYRAELMAKYSTMQFYVHGESTIETQIPLGEYEIYYATGDTWYGEDDLFGEDTVYMKCDGTFLFSCDEYGSNGWILTLTPVINGNLDTDEISEKDFPK